MRLFFLIFFSITVFIFPCEIQYKGVFPRSSNFLPVEGYILNTEARLFVEGLNFVKVYNISTPEFPMPAGQTTDLSGCGDTNQCTWDISMWKDDDAIFESTRSHGIRIYSTTNPATCLGYVDVNNFAVIGVFKAQNRRYLIFPSSIGSVYADVTNLPGQCKNINYSVLSELKDKANQVTTFEYNNNSYLALSSLDDSFTLYNVSNFPSFQKVFEKSDKSYDSAYYNGEIFVYSMGEKKVKVYDIYGNLKRQSQTFDYPIVYGINADSNYVYLALGPCYKSNGKYRAFDILDKTTLNSIIPSDFSLITESENHCSNTTDYDIVPYSNYFYRLARDVIEIYQLSCGDYANVILNSYSPTNVDPGTTFYLNISLKNTGNVAAQNVNATLSETHDKVTVRTPNQSYGTIPANQSFSKSFDISVDSSATAGPINFTLNVTTDNAGDFTFNFTVYINEPHPILVRTITKNSTSDILDVTYSNTGNIDFTGSFNLELIPYTKGVSFQQSSDTFSNIPKEQSQTKSYTYYLNNICTTLNFISLKAKENPPTSDTPEEELNVSIIPGNYPFIKRESSNLTKNDLNYTLRLYLKNIGQATGNNINVIISSENTLIQWIQNEQNYGSIVKDFTVYRDFTFTTAEGATGMVNFTAEITSEEGCWVYMFSHDLSDIKFDYIDEKHCGCGIRCTNDHPEIYEGSDYGTSCVEFSFKLKNNGTSNANSIPAILSIADNNPNVSVLVGESYYTINSGGEGYNSPPFQVSISKDFCSGNDSTCPELKLKVTIPGYNFEKEVQFSVKSSEEQPSTSCNLSYKSGSLQITSDSNSDGKANPGETIQFTIEIQNTGNADAPSVKGTISEDSSKEDYIILNKSEVGFGTIQASKTVRNSTPFQFTLAGDAPTGNYYFPLSITSSCSSSPFSGTIPIIVYSSGGGTVNLSYQSYYVDTFDKNYLEPGKTQSLYVTLKNESSSTLSKAQATLSTTEQKVQIYTQGSYTIMAGKEGTALFTVYIDSSFTGNSIPFHIEVQNATVTNPDFSVAVNSSSSHPSSSIQSLAIPVIVHSPGAEGTFWKTDVFLQNPSSEKQTLTLKLLKADQENQEPPETQVDLFPNSSLTIKDILDNASYPEFRGYSLAGLLIEFSSSIPPFVSSRIYNDQADKGTYGQFVPGISVSNITRGTAGDIPAYLVGMLKNSNYRSNVGLANVSPSYNELEITLIDSFGFPAGSKITKVLAPYNVTQIQDIASAAGLEGEIGEFIVKVESNSKADFIAWGSVVDNKTGDASFINDQIQSNKKSLIMGVAHAKGAVGTNWRTDLNVYNPSSSDIKLILTYYRYGYTNFTRTIKSDLIPSGGTVIIEDVLSKFTGLSENEAGFLVLYPENTVDKNPIASARTYNDLGNSGTYGQFVSGLDFENGGILSGKKLYFSGITINENFRANLGILNADDKNPNTITVSLYSKEGNFLSSFSEYMENPLTGIQINYNDLINKFNSIPIFEGYTIVVEGTTKTFAYISQVDNKTSDPIFILPSLR